MTNSTAGRRDSFGFLGCMANEEWLWVLTLLNYKVSDYTKILYQVNATHIKSLIIQLIGKTVLGV